MISDEKSKCSGISVNPTKKIIHSGFNKYAEYDIRLNGIKSLACRIFVIIPENRKKK